MKPSAALAAAALLALGCGPKAGQVVVVYTSLDEENQGQSPVFVPGPAADGAGSVPLRSTRAGARRFHRGLHEVRVPEEVVTV